MHEIMQNRCSNRVASHRQSNILRMLALLALLVGVAIVFGLSSPVPTTSATAKDAPRKPAVLVQDECEELPEEGEPVCTDEKNGSQTCTTNFREPFTMEVTNPCTGDHVLIEGEMHMVTKTYLDQFGSKHGAGPKCGSGPLDQFLLIHLILSFLLLLN